MTIMFDTNILISAGLFPNSRFSRLTVQIAEEHQIVLSSRIADVDVFVTGDKDFAGLDLERPEVMTIAAFEQKYL